jgi:hypothetical protein
VNVENLGGFGRIEVRMNPSPFFGRKTLSSNRPEDCAGLVPSQKVFTESLILAQDERWRRA